MLQIEISSPMQNKYLMLERGPAAISVSRSVLLRWHIPNLEIVFRNVTFLAAGIHGHQPALLVALAQEDGELLVLGDGQLVGVLRREVEESHGGCIIATWWT